MHSFIIFQIFWEQDMNCQINDSFFRFYEEVLIIYKSRNFYDV